MCGMFECVHAQFAAGKDSSYMGSLCSGVVHVQLHTRPMLLTALQCCTHPQLHAQSTTEVESFLHVACSAIAPQTCAIQRAWKFDT